MTSSLIKLHTTYNVDQPTYYLHTTYMLPTAGVLHHGARAPVQYGAAEDACYRLLWGHLWERGGVDVAGRHSKKKNQSSPQVNLAEQLTSSDFGVSTGLIPQGY
jgi:hypothetical protein